MGARFLQSFTFFFLCLILSSAKKPEQEDSSIAKKLHIKEIRITKKLEYEKIPVVIYPHSISETQLDTIPIINPTPTYGTPIIIPDSPPPPYMTTTPPITTLPPPITTPPITTLPPPITAAPTITAPTTPIPTAPTTSSGGTWCVASQSASDTALQVALDYACGYGGADCSAIQPGASCSNPDTLRDHASFAFNSYYQKNPAPTSCVFGGAAALTNTDPSSGSCRFPSTRTSTTPPTTPTPPTTTVTPSPPAPSTTSPMNPYYNPTTPTIYGEPTESPSSAITLSRNLVLLYATTVFSIIMTNHLYNI